MKVDINQIRYYGSAGLICVLCCLIFYPGILSSDSLDQISQAVNSSYVSWHPPIMAIVMHYLYLPLGLGGIFCLHQMLYWLSWAFFWDFVFGKKKVRYLFIGFFTPLFLISLTVWKDTGTLVSLFAATVLLAIYFRNRKSILLLPIILLLFYAFNVRTNGFIIVSTFIFSIIFALLFLKRYSLFLILLCSIIATGICSFSFYSINSYINQQNKVLQVSAFPSLVLWDVAGIYWHEHLYNIPPPDWAEKSTSNKGNWIKEYQAGFCSLCWTSEVKCKGDPSANKIYIKYWINKVLENPLAYLKHRLSVSKKLYGFEFRTYYPFHSHKQQNSIGGDFSIGTVGVVLLYLFYGSERILSVLHLYQPLIFLLLGAYCWWLSFKKIFIERFVDYDYIIVFGVCTSSIISALSLFILSVAADYRYLICSVLGSLISFFMLLNKKSEFKILKNFYSKSVLSIFCQSR